MEQSAAENRCFTFCIQQFCESMCLYDIPTSVQVIMSCFCFICIQRWSNWKGTCSPSRRGAIFHQSWPKGLTHGFWILGHTKVKNPFLAKRFQFSALLREEIGALHYYLNQSMIHCCSWTAMMNHRFWTRLAWFIIACNDLSWKTMVCNVLHFKFIANHFSPW